MYFTKSPTDTPYKSVPLIGYNNVVSQYASVTPSAPANPPSNLGNPATSSTWQANDAGYQRINMTLNGAIDYVAIAKHNFLETGSSIGIAVTNNPNSADQNLSLRTLLHFDGPNLSTNVIDSSGLDENWQPNGGFRLNTSLNPFGSAGVSCGEFDGASSTFVQTGGGKFNLANRSYTIDLWFRLASIGRPNVLFDARHAFGAVSPLLYVDGSDNKLHFVVGPGIGVVCSTVLAANTWYHVAVCRSGTSTRIFLNGVQDVATITDSTNYVCLSYFTIGTDFNHATGLNGYIDEFRFLDSVAAFTSNFTAPSAPYPDGLTWLFGSFSSLLHCDGPNGSTALIDSGGDSHAWTAVGNAHLDTSIKQFGTASMSITSSAGQNGAIVGDGSKAFAFGLGDFTIDFWFRLSSLGTYHMLFDFRPDVNDPINLLLYVDPTAGANKLILANLIAGTTSLVANTWYHCAVCRFNGTTHLFLNGSEEGSASDPRNYANFSNRPVFGNWAGFNSNLLGWMDEIRILRGTTLFAATFTPPTRPADQFSLPGKVFNNDDSPVVFRFPQVTAAYVVLFISPSPTNTTLHTIAVINAGKLLVLERSVKVDTPHEVINFARKSSIVSGMSENGQFLGRVVLAEWRESKAEFAWFTPDWYRANFEPFVAQAVENPFFWVWNPDEYPAETAYAWLSEDVVPETDPTTRRVAATISMRATA